jgi:hypothetical protein
MNDGENHRKLKKIWTCNKRKQLLINYGLQKDHNLPEI